MTPLSRAFDTVSGMWRARVPLCVIELDYGDGDTVAWEFYEAGVVRFRDALANYEEWSPLWEYALE